jgi:hypothetical protein
MAQALGRAVYVVAHALSTSAVAVADGLGPIPAAIPALVVGAGTPSRLDRPAAARRWCSICSTGRACPAAPTQTCAQGTDCIFLPSQQRQCCFPFWQGGVARGNCYHEDATLTQYFDARPCGDS